MTDKDQPEIKYLGDVQRLVLNPGDIVVLSVDEYIPNEAAQRLRSQLEASVPGHNVVVLSKGMKIGALGQDIAA